MKIADDFYEQIKPGIHRRIARQLRSARRIVDVGCGNCELASLLSKEGACEVIGVDIRDGSFPGDPDATGGRQCVKADARSLDFLASHTVDAVVSVWALHELAAPMAVLREAKRILRAGGKILIVDFPRGSLAQRLWNEKYYTAGEVGEMLKRAGFARVEAKRIAQRQLIWALGAAPSRGRAGHEASAKGP